MRSVVTILVLVAIAACVTLPGQSLSPEDWFLQGVSSLNSGRYDEAIGAFSEAVELNPNYAEAYRNRGLAWAKKGEHDRAIADFTRALELNPKDAQAYHNRGTVWAEKGALVRGLTDAKKALGLEPTNRTFSGLVIALQGKIEAKGEDRFQQGVSFLKARRYDEAIGAFSEAVELNPKYAEAYRNRGLAWAKKGEHDRAIADFTRAVELNPKDAEAYRNRGLAWAKKDSQVGLPSPTTAARRLTTPRSS